MVSALILLFLLYFNFQGSEKWLHFLLPCREKRERKLVSSVFSLSDEFNPRFLILAPKSRFYKNVPGKSSGKKWGYWTLRDYWRQQKFLIFWKKEALKDFSSFFFFAHFSFKKKIFILRKGIFNEVLIRYALGMYMWWPFTLEFYVKWVFNKI